MKCPHCNNELEIVDNSHPFYSMYESSNARTACCGNIVRVVPIMGHRVEKSSFVLEDDWGN